MTWQDVATWQDEAAGAPDPLAEAERLLAGISWSQSAVIALVGVAITWLAARFVFDRVGRGLRFEDGPAAPPAVAAEAALTAIAAYLGFLLLLGLAGDFLAEDGGANDAGSTRAGVLATMAMNSAVVIVVLIAARLRHGVGPATLGLAPPRPRAFGLAPPLLIALIPAWIGVNLINAKLVRHFDLAPRQELVESLLAVPELRRDVVLLGLVIVAGPILEEILFRGFLQRALRATVGPRLAIVGSSILFALVHGASAALPIFVLSLALGVLAERAGSIWPSAFAHALFNGASIALIHASSP